jgi:hypothetical protein
MHVHRQLLTVLFLLYDIEKSNVNAKMSECRRKGSSASVFRPVVSCLSPACIPESGFRLLPLVTIIPALPSSEKGKLIIP